MSAQHTERPHASSPPLRTVADIRAALRDGRGFPGDAESFEADLARALDASTATDLHQIADVIKTYAGSIRASSDPEFDDALLEGLGLIAEIKKGNQEWAESSP
ncbi:DUF6247 family protein [Streptomyces capitiformicae]|uniref:Uncharacterized protein n=1 Tax=Streptomyces capitiformicae TaxID=2014920 RepID=A0A918YZA5_9ACTN|nr:hypothetical protein GCM10017771_45430 [Streptomyces capitiformicae]